MYLGMYVGKKTHEGTLKTIQESFMYHICKKVCRSKAVLQSHLWDHGHSFQYWSDVFFLCKEVAIIISCRQGYAEGDNLAVDLLMLSFAIDGNYALRWK